MTAELSELVEDTQIDIEAVVEADTLPTIASAKPFPKEAFPATKSATPGEAALMNLVGHNSGANGSSLLRSVRKIEKLEDAKKQIASEIKEEYAALRERGFPTTTLKHIQKLMKLDVAEQKNRAQDMIMYDEAINQGTLFGQYFSNKVREEAKARHAAIERGAGGEVIQADTEEAEAVIEKKHPPKSPEAAAKQLKASEKKKKK